MNLSNLYTKERRELIAILQAWDNHGLPEGFLDAEVQPVQLNNQVGLTNSDYQVAVLDESDGTLKLWHTLPSSGYDGMLHELMYENTPDDLDIHDERYIKQELEFQDLLNTGRYPAWQEEDDEEEED